MQKKSAIILSLAALMAAGVTFGTLKYKDEREKEKIKKELNDILIPEAEEKLNTLLLTDKSLQDSIAYYNDRIRELEQDSLISRTDVDVISDLLSSIDKDHQNARAKWNEKYFDLYYGGDGYFDEDNLPEEAARQIRYLNGGILKKFDEDTTWTIPGRGVDYDVIDFGNGRVRAGMFPYPLGRPHYSEGYIFAQTSGFDTYFQEVMYSLEQSLSEVLPFEATDEWDEEYDPKYQLDITDQEQLLRTLKCFVEKIDNSQNVINPSTLQKLKTVVDSLLIKADKKNLRAKRANYHDKLSTFRGAEYDINRQISQQRRILEKYKSPNAVQNIRLQRTTHK